MPRQLRIEIENGFYHVTVRGNKRETIFETDADYERFLMQLERTLKSYQVILYAYVLMKNHFHLLIKTPKGNLSRFMQRLNTSYSLYYRYKHKKPGHCFQGRFGAKIIQDDSYLKMVSRYIHLNPAKIKATAKLSSEEKYHYLMQFKWSSLSGYVSKKDESVFICYDVLKTFSADEKKARKLYMLYMCEGLSGEKSGEYAGNIMNENSYAIGEENFLVMIGEAVKKRKRGEYDRYDIIIPKRKRLDISLVEDFVCEEFNIERNDLRKDCRIAGMSKEIAVELSCRYTALSMRKIGSYLGKMSAGGVGSIRKRFILNGIENTKEFRNLQKKLEKELLSID